MNIAVWFTYPRVGPPTTAKAYPTMAVPRCEGDQMSPRTPPVFVTGADPNSPAKNLVIRIVWISLAVAVPNEKHAAMKYGTRTAGLLPYLIIYQYSNLFIQDRVGIYSHFT